MFHPVKVGKRIRYSYARIKDVMRMPHLLDVQRNSYSWFKREGLAEIFRDISPISDFTGNLELFFEDFTFGEPKYTLEECKRRDGTYAAPVRVNVKLRNKAKGNEVREQSVFMGDFPLMTETGTFIINGAERVIVSQLVRSPGAYFDKTVDLSGRTLYTATVIPNRGAWIELETDTSHSISVRIDRTRKMPLPYFLRSLGIETNDQILDLFGVDYFVESRLRMLAQTLLPLCGLEDKDRLLRSFLTDNTESIQIETEEETVDNTELTEYLKQFFEENIAERLTDLLVNDPQLLALVKGDAISGSFARNEALADRIKNELPDVKTDKIVDLLTLDVNIAELVKTKRPKNVTDSLDFEQLLSAFHNLDKKFDRLSTLKFLLDKICEVDVKNQLAFGFQALVNQLDLDVKNADDNRERALLNVYTRLRPGEPPSADNAHQMLQSLFFDPRRYDLAQVGRYKITKKLGWRARLIGKTLAEDICDPETGEVLLPADIPLTQQDIENVAELISAHEADIFELTVDRSRRGFKTPIKIKVKSDWGNFQLLCAPTVSITDNRTLSVADMACAVGYLFDLMSGLGFKDDIDHLGNRRVRAVGELLQNQFRVGMARMERVVRERMTTQDAEIITPQNLINIRPVVAAIKEFFGSSQLSQFMDQHNPLSELTHKRRLSALGPGGLSRERAGFEVRDVHNSHYGRMCPIETPEGPNIGLIGSLSNFARVNKFGFIETPYRRVDRLAHRVTNDVVYLTADAEESLIIAQANEPLDDNDWFINERVTARRKEETTKVPRLDVDFMDVSPKQVVSIATALIPFLENDDANRALMGANMQRQAVPLLRTQAPLVGTGMEFKAACDSGVMVLAKRSGTVVEVDSALIKVKVDDFLVNNNNSFDIYHLTKFARSNQGTCINQIPIVDVGQHVDFNEPLADGPATHLGELALGFNIIVAYMPWEGYNYEDAILLNENLIKRDIFSSIHIEEYQCDSRETKLGPEEITRDIPNVSEDSLANLDSDGIIAIGSDVRTGDILVGKVTPKGETELTAEERLLRAIFGEKAREVRDTSLRVPHGEAGKVVAVNIFNRDNNDELAPGVSLQVRVFIAQKRKISVGDKMSGRHGNKGVVSEIRRQEDMPFLPDGTPVDIVLNPLGVPSRMNIGQILETHLGMAVRQIGLRIKNGDSVLQHKVFGQLPFNVDEPFTIATPVFDGRTGLPFENRVTVGCVYMLKLHHLVDDKIHARSTGPYSLVTQQPLGGKAQFGGQRFGEMEVWALEAYGAAFTLQEILTVKSDDVVGRVKAYEAIVKGQNIPEPGVPESFKVLIKELQSIGLDIRVLNADSKEIIIRDDDDDDSAIKNKAVSLGLDVGNFADHDVHSSTGDEQAEHFDTAKDYTHDDLIADSDDFAQ